MNRSVEQPALQQKTLRLYGELLCRRESWSRQLALAAFPGASASGFAAAASLAGAVSLVVDSDAAMVKMHFRDGAFDFVVNTLDEALRAIKNEVRQGNALSIGLIAEPVDALAEAAERGLSAGFVLVDSVGPSEPSVMSDDAELVAIGESLKPSPKLEHWLLQRQWNGVEVASVKLVADDRVRSKWVRDLAAHQRSVRGGNRWVWLSAEEVSGIEESSGETA
jgi:hypothetical protein